MEFTLLIVNCNMGWESFTGRGKVRLKKFLLENFGGFMIMNLLKHT